MGLGVQQFIAALDHYATQLLATVQLSGHSVWPDLILDNKPLEGQKQLGAKLYQTYLRLFQMARAYRFSNNQQLQTALINSLTLLNRNYYHQDAVEC